MINIMKKIIDGKKYDTNTAELMGEWDSDSRGNFDYVCERLYRKKTGEFFLYGEGGANSKYSVRTGTNEWSGGSEIIPISEENARRWSEKYLSGDEYENIFGEVDE